MNGTLKAVAVVVFVGALSAVLVRPILTAYDEQSSAPNLPIASEPTKPKKARPTPSPAEPTPTPTPEVTPESSTESGEVAVASSLTLTNPYPKRCLRPSSAPGGDGTIAAFEGGRVALASPTGDVIARLEAVPPLQWSPSGTFLAASGAQLWRSDGTFAGSALGLCSTDGCKTLEQWGWSTAGDCIVGIAEGALYVGGPDRKTRTLLDTGVRSFSFSPNGEKLALVVGLGGDTPTTNVVRINLRSGKVTSLLFQTGEIATSLAGWSVVGGDVLVWIDPGVETGRKLVGLTPGSGAEYTSPPNVVRAFDPISAIARCGDSLLSVLSVDDLRSSKTRLAFIGRAGISSFVTDPDQYRQVSCSPTGEFIVASVANRKQTRIVVLTRDGETLQELSSGYSVSYPSWGRQGTGALFVRTDAGDRSRRLWFIPEGAAAQATALSMHRDDSCGLEGLFDWSADEPTGFPAGYNLICVSANS